MTQENSPGASKETVEIFLSENRPAEAPFEKPEGFVLAPPCQGGAELAVHAALHDDRRIAPVDWNFFQIVHEVEKMPDRPIKLIVIHPVETDSRGFRVDEIGVSRTHLVGLIKPLAGLQLRFGHVHIVGATDLNRKWGVERFGFFNNRRKFLVE